VLLHREGLMSYLYGIPEADRPGRTIGDPLREKSDLKRPAVYIREMGTLPEAKEALEKIENCKAVLETKTAASTDPVVGLLTSTDISKYSRA